MEDKGAKNIHLTEESNDFADLLVEKGFFTMKEEAFRLGFAIALGLDPDTDEFTKEKKVKNIRESGKMDENQNLSFLIQKLSSKHHDKVHTRMQDLGDKGLRILKQSYWDGETINWKELKKDLNN